MTQTPNDALRLVPVEPTEAMQNAGVDAATNLFEGWVDEGQVSTLYRSMLSAAPASPLPGGGLEPLENDPAVAALCDSNYRAGALAGWNAANHSDPAEGERIMAHIREVEPGSLAPILERNRLRKLPAAPTGAK